MDTRRSQASSQNGEDEMNKREIIKALEKLVAEWTEPNCAGDNYEAAYAMGDCAESLEELIEEFKKKVPK